MKWLLGCGILMALALILFVVAAGLAGLSWSRVAQDTGYHWSMWWRWCPSLVGSRLVSARVPPPRPLPGQWPDQAA
jgi:hypothetical protein